MTYDAIPSDPKHISKIVGFLAMGDGGVYKGAKSRNYRFIMNMIQDHADFIEWAAKILSRYTPDTKVSVKERHINASDGFRRSPQYRLETGAAARYTNLHDRLYSPGGYKGLSTHHLKLMDWQALAILFMCDGCTHKDFRPSVGMINPSYNVTLNLKRLNLDDTITLQKSIETLGVSFSVQTNKYNYLRLPTKQVETFMHGISPYIFPSFRYKVV